MSTRAERAKKRANTITNATVAGPIKKKTKGINPVVDIAANTSVVDDDKVKAISKKKTDTVVIKKKKTRMGKITKKMEKMRMKKEY